VKIREAAPRFIAIGLTTAFVGAHSVSGIYAGPRDSDITIPVPISREAETKLTHFHSPNHPYEIDYPASWITFSQIDEPGQIPMDVFADQNDKHFGNIMIMSVANQPVNNLYTLEVMLRNGSRYSPSAEISRSTMLGREALVYTRKGLPDSKDHWKDITAAFFNTNNRLWLVGVESDPLVTSKYRRTYQKMLSTLQINPS